MIDIELRGTGLHKNIKAKSIQAQIGSRYDMGGEPDLSRLLARLENDFGTPMVGFLGVDDPEAFTIMMSLNYGTATSAELGPRQPYTIMASGYRHNMYLAGGGKLTKEYKAEFKKIMASSAARRPKGRAATTGALPKTLEFEFHGKTMHVPFVTITKGIEPRHFFQKGMADAIKFFEEKAKAEFGEIQAYKRYPQGVVVGIMNRTLDYMVQRITAHMGPRFKKFARSIVIVPVAAPGKRSARRRAVWR